MNIFLESYTLPLTVGLFGFFSGDAPPHGLGQVADEFPNGCPTGNDPIRACRTMVENGIVLYSVGCEPAICRYKDFFMGIAFMTGGQYVPLSKAQALSKVRINILTKGVNKLWHLNFLKSLWE